MIYWRIWQQIEKKQKNRNLLGFETCKDTAWDIDHGLLHIEEVEKVAQKTS